MIFEELVLQNFGPYRGRRVIHLATREGRPIVLIGGLNGAGKTSLLDALQLVLYGKTAQCSKRFGIGYEEFLRRSTHRRSREGEETAVELSLLRAENGVMRRYRLRRSWVPSDTTVRDRVEVEVDGVADDVLSDTWESHVEQLIPRRVSPLFFFDGEKVEGLADPERSSDMLSRAVHSLLGVDLIDRLSTDLVVLERRKQADLRSADDRRRIQAAKSGFVSARDRHQELVGLRAQTQNRVDRRQKALRDVERRLEDEGADLFLRRTELNDERATAEVRLIRARESVAHCSAGDAPLLMVAHLLHDVVVQDSAEREAERAAILDGVLESRDRELLGLLQGAPTGVVSSVRDFLARDRDTRVRSLRQDVYLHLESHERNALTRADEQVRLDVPGQVDAAMAELRGALAALDDADRKLAAIPAAERVVPLLDEKRGAEEELREALTALKTVDDEIRAAEADLEAKRTKLKALLEQAIDREFQEEGAARLLDYSRKVRGTLQTFRDRVIESRISSIAAAASESLRALMRKQSQFDGLYIDPVTFAVGIHRQDGSEVPSEILSAGERQILAVALLWGLARVSARELPIVIDTPLGRLDSVHRAQLVNLYFPRASHQVVLLSTDEEISNDHYAALRPFIGAEYHLWYNESEETTEILTGYHMSAAGATC